MAKSGDPNGGSDPEWPAVSNKHDAYLEIDATTAARKGGPADADCDFWDAAHDFEEAERIGGDAVDLALMRCGTREEERDRR